MRCCTCSKWVHLKCSLLFISRFKILGSSHSWSCHPCCVPAFSGDLTSNNTGLPSLNTFTVAFKPLILLPPISYLLYLYLHHRLMLLAVFNTSCFFFLPDSLKVLQWNAGGLLDRSTKLLHSISSHPVDLIRIQESNLLFSFFFP